MLGFIYSSKSSRSLPSARFRFGLSSKTKNRTRKIRVPSRFLFLEPRPSRGLKTTNCRPSMDSIQMSNTYIFLFIYFGIQIGGTTTPNSHPPVFIYDWKQIRLSTFSISQFELSVQICRTKFRNDFSPNRFCFVSCLRARCRFRFQIVASSTVRLCGL